jgi:hypothetical protein
MRCERTWFYGTGPNAWSGIGILDSIETHDGGQKAGEPGAYVKHVPF